MIELSTLYSESIVVVYGFGFAVLQCEIEIRQGSLRGHDKALVHLLCCWSWEVAMVLAVRQLYASRYLRIYRILRLRGKDDFIC